MQLESDKWKNRIVKIDVFLDKKEATQIDIIRQLLFHAGKMPSKALAEQVGLTQNALKKITTIVAGKMLTLIFAEFLTGTNLIIFKELYT